jgi:hypothetical protein
MTDRNNAIRRLGQRAFFEFEDVADFIWKSPGLIEAEIKSEISKLEAYFPLTGDGEHDKEALRLREHRWFHERRKLSGVFPFLMSTGNLFSTIALFETYCLMLCKELQAGSGVSISEAKGIGISRWFKYLSNVGVNWSAVTFCQQVQAALKIRNCLFHASGLLASSRDEAELRKLVSDATYLSPEHRRRRRALQAEFGEVAVALGPLGDQLKITNRYPWLVSYYVREYFVALCDCAASHPCGFSANDRE